MKTLIVYGTRYGATAENAEEIAKILHEEGFDVKVANAKKEKIKDITSYELVVVGSGLQMGKWTGEAEDFLKKHAKELAEKKLALFVSTMKMVSEREGKTEDVEKIHKMGLEDKVDKYSLQPIALGFFGGVLDFNKMNILFRRTFGMIRSELEKDGFKEEPEGVYEIRDWEEIRVWAKELAQKAQQ
ncbi:MAG: flavodoxin domain-containing protein [Candidatus Bathyarchaeia archaeon]|jgi:menaquinone-dependent protoporphyrinogen oxidase